jgi:hypothetical protein
LAATPGPLSPHPSAETIAGVRPGAPEQDVPASWRVPTHSEVQVAGKSLSITTYPTGIMTLSQQGEILLLLAREGYQGTSAQGIALGSTAQDVLTRYGPPTRRHELSQGQSWAYDAPRLAFQFYDDQVISWLRF